MNRKAAFGQLVDLRLKAASLAGGLVLLASTAQMQAQAPGFAFGTGYPIPATEGPYTYNSLAVDRAGNLYLEDYTLKTIQKIPAGGNQLEPVAIGGLGNPLWVSVDPAGNVYVADDTATPGGQSTATIFKLSPNGAHSSVGSGWLTPVAVGADAIGNVFVLDLGFNLNSPAVWEVPVGSSIKFLLPIHGLSSPNGMAVDPKGNVYVTDYNLGTIVKLPYGSATQQTVVHGLTRPWGVATDLAGDLFYLNGNTISELPAGSSTPITAWSWQNSGTSAAPYIQPLTNVTVDGNGTLYFDGYNNGNYFIAKAQHASVDFGSNEICVPGWTSSCLVKQVLWLNTVNASTPQVQVMSGGVPSTEFTTNLSACNSISISAGYGCELDVTFLPKFAGPRSADLQVLNGDGSVSTHTLLHGIGSGPQVAFGPAVQSTLYTDNALKSVTHLAVDQAGNLYATLFSSKQVLKYPVGGGAPVAIGKGFSYPYGVAVDGLGNTFVVDSVFNQLIKVRPDGTQTVLSQNLTTPTGVALDNNGNAFVADRDGNRVVEVSAIGSFQTTVQGGSWVHPLAIALDGQGNIYTADGAASNAGSAQVRKLDVSTGISSILGSGFLKPCGIAVDAAGDVYVGDMDLAGVVEVAADGTQTTLGTGITDPCGVTVDATGNVFVADRGNSRIVKLSVSNVPSLSFATTSVGQTSSDSPKSVQITNVGNAPLIGAGGLSNSTNFAALNTSPSGTPCGQVFWLEPGVNCELSYSFTPTIAGPLTSQDLLAFNAYPDEATIPLSGTGTDVATNIIAVSGGGQTAAYGTAFAAPLKVLVLDAAGNGVANMPVTFSGTGFKFDSAIVLTNASGIASATATAVGVGTLHATATVAGVTTTAAFSETGVKAVVNVYPTLVAWDYGQPIVLKDFVVYGMVNGDKYTGAPALTTTAVAGSSVGNYVITASKGSFSAPSSYTVIFNTGRLIIDTPNSILTYSGSGQTGAAGVPLTAPFTVRVFGTSGRALGGVPITFAGASMKFSSASVSTASPLGLASVTATPTAVGSLTATATVTGTTMSASFSATATSPVPAAIKVVSGSGQTAVYGASFAKPFTVLVTDSMGHVSANTTVTFTGTGIKTASHTANTNASGVATMTGVATGTGPLSVVATVGGVTKGATFSEIGTPAPLVVTANDGTGTYSQPLPALTYTITGFVNGDTTAAVSGQPLETTPATPLSTPGTYPIYISVGTLSSLNYTFTSFVNGTFTLNSIGSL